MLDRDRLDRLRETARDAMWAGDYQRCLSLYDEGLREIRDAGNPELEDLFVCNRNVVLMEMDRTDFDLSRLKEILLRHPDSHMGVQAAHACARGHELRGELTRARFYATMALERSRACGFEDLVGGSLNVLGNLELRASRFEAARDLYREALERIEHGGDEAGLPVSIDNLGYCLIALGQPESGTRLVQQAVNLFALSGARQAMDYPCLDLSLANIQVGRLDAAEFWGRRALELGTEFHRVDVLKNAHFLLGEAYTQMGRPERADEHFGVLADHYPDLYALKDLLRQVSLLDVINLV